jgi:hypothetical protein
MTRLEIVIAVATLLGPVLAVQAQKWIERATERKRGRAQVFATLMATRATRLSPDHVNALNRIELEFNGRGSKTKAVRNAWRMYADKLNDSIDPSNDAAVASWSAERDNRFIDLMFEMSNAVGYDFDRVQLRRGIYYPVAHSDYENRQKKILSDLEKVLAGEQAIPMRLVIPDDLADLEAQLKQRMILAYSEGVLKVKSAEG